MEKTVIDMSTRNSKFWVLIYLTQFFVTTLGLFSVTFKAVKDINDIQVDLDDEDWEEKFDSQSNKIEGRVHIAAFCYMIIQVLSSIILFIKADKK